MADSNNDKFHLSFTIGPVQAFVAQARRTRDLWAGSWLLSYLAECALVAAEETGGTAIIPHRDGSKKITSKESPVGGIPNRFELRFDSAEKAKQAADNAKAAMLDAWNKVADAVWNEFLESVADKHGDGTREIWDRHVDHFWEVSWVIGTPEGQAKTIAKLAAARKNIRHFQAQSEPGTKCSLMGTLQELSGQYGKSQKQFWKALGSQNSSLDLKENERLCAIAFIKRLYPHVIEKAIGNDICDVLKRQDSWPSTAFFAALPWLKKVQTSASDVADHFAIAAISAGRKQSERQAANDTGFSSDWANLDGPAWFTDAIRQDEPGMEILGPKPTKEDQRKRKEEFVQPLLTKLNELYETVGAKPVPYYALLLMDGDSMGKLVANLGSPQKVSSGLDNFAKSVDSVVRKTHLGRTIYAGGDDVLAIVPAENALTAADYLARKYAESFDGIPEATLSGAIVYAHWKFPLRQVLQTAHRLLDDIAKDQTGRDSLAIGIIQGSGLNAIWSAPWNVVRGNNENGFGKFEEFIQKFGSDSTSYETTEFNASFLYLLREQFSKLFATPIEMPGSYGEIDIGNDLLTDIANSEYRRRMNKDQRKKTSPDQTRATVKPLLALSQQWKRDEETKAVASNLQTFSFDGWRVARFLKQVQDGKVDGHE